MRLVATPVSDAGDVEMLRTIRNACRGSFAHDNEEVTTEAQAIWWTSMQGRIHAWLYAHLGEVIGYGLIRLESGRWWDSVAVLPAARNQGFGTEICSDLAQRVDHPIWSEVRPGNFAARRMHHDVEWELVGWEGGIVQYRSRVGVQA